MINTHQFGRYIRCCFISLFIISSTTVMSKESLQQVEVIEVYAQKRAQKLQDVSVAVTVVSEDALQRQQIKDTSQLAKFTPNMKITNNAGEGTPPAFNIRGIGMIDYNTSTISPIAVYSDGIVSGSANNLATNIFDLEQVEVLRGPQGTLFGRNTTGGAILLRSKMPEQQFGGYINAGIAEYQTTSIDGAINLPFSDTTAARIAFDHDDYQFSTNNLMPEQPDGGLKQTNVRLIVRSQFDDLTATIKLHKERSTGKPKPIASNGIYRKDNSGQCTPSIVGSNDCVDAYDQQVGGDDFWDVRADTADRKHNTDSWGSALILDWQLTEHSQLTSITGVRKLTRFHSFDSDGARNLIEGTFDTNNNLYSQEVNLSITQQNYFWQTGIFYLKETIEQNNSFDLFRDFRSIPSLADVPATFFYDNSLENASTALYSQLDYTLTKDTTLITGIRFTKEETDYKAKADLNTVHGNVPKLWDLAGNISDNEFSGKLAINHALANDINLFASYTRGYKSGGYNAGYSTSPEQAMNSEYAPETLNAYEAGAKVQWLDHNARWHLAAFYYDYQDQQVFINIQDSAVPYHVLKNAGASEIYGLDSEFYYAPTNQLEFVLNIGYLPEASIGKFQQENLFVNDNRLPFSSKWNVSGYLLTEFQFFTNPLTMQLGFDYQSEFYFDQNENPYTKQNGYTVFNGSIHYAFHPDFSLTLWGKNLTKTEFAELRFDSIAALGAVTELKGEARQFGATLQYRF
ncbi:TonB-dependent receptor [Thalassotalea sp. PP2-459]|uniref:TonB-dependent receptor n=1 Tax=Thalassotalea sp. PP2-459 TaxID=1742724 RepID=UPI0009454B5E|nr:TonB-dependent receptor [Thalassotalea sp. PP2-459]OKY26628.1 hypothetical protein BI291_01110 [Thalassotalea sp. PP2-459]